MVFVGLGQGWPGQARPGQARVGLSRVGLSRVGLGSIKSGQYNSVNKSALNINKFLYKEIFIFQKASAITAPVKNGPVFRAICVME